MIRSLSAVCAIAMSFVFASCYLDELTAPPADQSSIEFGLAGDSIVLLGDSIQLSAAFDGGAGTGVTRVTWISRDTTVARVDAVRGVVRGVKAGTTQIEAYLVAPDLDNDLLRTWPMEVRYAGIGMVNDSLTGLGETRQLEARGLDVQGGMHEVVPAVFWSPDDRIIAIDSSGVVVARQNGSASVNARWDEFTTTAPILVRQVAGRISFGVPAVQFPVLNADTTVMVAIRDTQDSIIQNPSLVWTSSDTTAFSVTANGVIRALRRTTGTVTLTSDTASAGLPVAVVQEAGSLTIQSGNNQTAQVGATVPGALVVVVQDGGGAAIEGALVTFSVTGGGGQIVDSVQLTDTNGVARLTNWVLGSTVGPNTVQAGVDTRAVTFIATGTPGSVSTATSIVTVSEDSIAAGGTTTITLQAKDQFGNDLTTGGATVVFALTGGTSNGTLGTVTDNGDGTYTVTFTGEVAGTATSITATVNGSSVQTVLPDVTVLPGSVAQLTIAAGNNQTDAVGTPVFIAPAVLVQDAYNNAVPGEAVTFTVSSGGGSVAGSPATSDANGIATAGSWTLGPTAGANTLTATLGALSVTFNATGTTQDASPANSIITVSVDTVAAGSFSTLTLQTKDNLDNNLTIGGYTVVFAHSGGTSTGSISATTDNGDGTYTATFTGELAGTATTVTATINGSTVTTTPPTITVTPGAASAATSIVTVSVASVASGSIVNFRLDSKDAFGNDITTGGSTVVFSLGGGTSTGAIGATIDNGDGSYTASFTGQAAGTAASVNATINGAAVTTTTPTVTVVPGPASPNTSEITVTPDTIPSAAIATLRLEARDAFGNVITTGGRTVTFAASGGTSTGTIGATTDNGDGTYTAPFTGQAAGTATTISSTLDAQAVTTTPPTVTVIPGAASPATSLVSVSADTIASATVATLTLQTRDAFGNDLTSGGNTVVFTHSGGTSTGMISATTDKADGTYAASFTGQLAGTATTINATINGQVVTTTLPTVTVVPGEPANIAVNLGDGQAALVNTPVPVPPSVVVTDANGNPVSGVAVTFAVTAGGGVVDPTAAVPTDADGIAATTSWTLGAAAGENTLTASAPSVGSTTFTATATSSAPVTFEEVVTASDTSGPLTMPAIDGGSNQTYVMFVTTVKGVDVTGVSGGGLTWTEQIEQCAASEEQMLRIWTAQGTPSGAFQAVAATDVSGKDIVAVLARYSNVGAFGSVAGNKNDVLPCIDSATKTATGTLTLTSTVDASVHLVGVSLKGESVSSVSAGYSVVGTQVVKNAGVFVYGRTFPTATSDVLNAMLSKESNWATAGIVLRPN